MARWNEGKALGFLFLSVLVVTVTSQRTFGKCEPYNYCKLDDGVYCFVVAGNRGRRM